MTKIRTASGADFALTFTLGLPPPLTGPNLYFLYDGSLAKGELDRDTNGKQWLRSFNPVGITPRDIVANKIRGWRRPGRAVACSIDPGTLGKSPAVPTFASDRMSPHPRLTATPRG